MAAETFNPGDIHFKKKMKKVQKSLSSFAQKTYEDGYSPRHGM